MAVNKVKAKEKKPYQKPAITIIDLVAEEVLAIGCKTATTSASPAIPSCLNATCSQIGS